MLGLGIRRAFFTPGIGERMLAFFHGLIPGCQSQGPFGCPSLSI